MKLEKLKKIRQENGFTQLQVCECLGFILRTYQQYEQGRREPDLEIIKKISDFFQCSIDDLI